MQIRFHGFEIQAGPSVSLARLFDELANNGNPVDYAGRQRIVSYRTSGQYTLGSVITLHPDRRYSRFRRDTGRIGYASLPANELFAGYNFFALVNATRRGLFTTVKDGMAVADFFRMLGSFAKRSHQEVRHRAEEAAGGRRRMTAAERNASDGNFSFLATRVMTNETLEELIRGWHRYNEVRYEVTTYHPRTHYGQTLTGDVRGEMTVLKLLPTVERGGGLSVGRRIIQFFRELQAAVTNLRSASVVGYPEDGGPARTIPVLEEIGEFGCYDIADLIDQGKINEENILNSDVFPLLRRTIEDKSGVFLTQRG